MIKEKEITIIEKDYLNDLKKIKETIRTNQNKAMVVVNSAMIMNYYEIGSIINQRKQWGTEFIERLANDLKEYGKVYSFRNLKYMCQFSNNFFQDEIFSQPGGQISWRSIISIISKCKDLICYLLR